MSIQIGVRARNIAVHVPQIGVRAAQIGMHARNIAAHAPQIAVRIAQIGVRARNIAVRAPSRLCHNTIAARHAGEHPGAHVFLAGVPKMKPYRDHAVSHAGLMLRNTETLAAKIIVLPNGTWMSDAAINTICDIFSVLAGQ